MGFASLMMLLFTRPIVGLFTNEPAVVEYAVQCLTIFAFAFVAWGAGMALIQAFNGAGDTMTPTWINVLCFWVVQVPLAYFLLLDWASGRLGSFGLYLRRISSLV